ncbi:MAG: hypothetical protein NVV72_14635 [Asticcacaulis sp.]|nr:hypothetical protein [Asticcacaulis sp.]
MRKPSKISQAAVERALKGASKSGLSFDRISVDVTTGVIDFFPGQTTEADAGTALDGWVKKQNAG